MCSILWTQISLRSGLVHNHASVLNCYRCYMENSCVYECLGHTRSAEGAVVMSTDCPETGDIIYNTKTGPDLLGHVWRQHSLHLHEESNPRMQFCEEKKVGKEMRNIDFLPLSQYLVCFGTLLAVYNIRVFFLLSSNMLMPDFIVLSV